MSRWVRKGLRTGIKTTSYPAREEKAAGISPGFPSGGDYPEEQIQSLLNRCPTHALQRIDGQIAFDHRRCIHCFRCAIGIPTPLDWQHGYEWAVSTLEGQDAGRKLGPAFGRSIHILVIDAGDCGACLNEVKQLNNAYYNMHRLGFFITPTPRQADVLLVVGAVTDHMRAPLQKAYDAMPTPKCVVAVGACALSGSVFGPSFVCGPVIGGILPVDVEIPGQPPPPLAILHGLLVAAGRKHTASIQRAVVTSSIAEAP
jgi:Ni,Fe-hydrogenase III small subunit